LEGIAGRRHTWSVADGGVERRADHGDVISLVGLDETFDRL
jgi:hypothetical protein